MTRESRSATTSGLSDAAKALWGKSGPDEGRLSLVQHLLDSAGVAEWVWRVVTPQSTKRAISRLTGLSVDDAGTLYRWLAGTHDIGKANRLFQTQLDARPGYEYLADRVRDAGLPTRASDDEINLNRLPHALASGILLEKWLVAEADVKPRISISLAAIADAHHGIVSPIPLREPARTILRAYPESWLSVHHEILEWVADLTGARRVLAKLSKPLRGPAQNLLTGLVIEADWLASNSDAFPLVENQETRKRLEAGVASADLTAPWQPRGVSASDPDGAYRARFGWDAEQTPRPMQRAIATALSETTGSALVIIEAPTGSGKTEAALVAAEILADHTNAGGVVFAAPTMSTSDALFSRVLNWARHATSSSEVTSMFLGHSKNVLNEQYSKFRRFSNIGIDESEPGNVVASQWFNGRKKGVLANFVVATVDQVLFLALQAKHSMLRHVALAGKVIVIDEVHAYSAYSNAYLYTAIRWLSRYGASLVLLSATLAESQKRSLIEAYAGQHDIATPRELSHAYPLLTIASSAGVVEVEPGSNDENAAIAITQMASDSTPALVNLISSIAPDSGCVLVICNTVARAQAAFDALEAQFPEGVELHHAAFVASDRAEKERLLRESMGPLARRGAGRPQHRIVVATQVAEQSLDIDADLLITDIAPIDLVIQRMGRLHRHKRPTEDRPKQLRAPQVFVRGILSTHPEPVLDRGAMAIYDPLVLLATLSLLITDFSTKPFVRPSDAARSVHAVYETERQIPSAWASAWQAATLESSRRTNEANARSKTYRFPEPARARSLDDQFVVRPAETGTADGETAGYAQVRDSDPSLEIIPIIATATGYRPLPWIGNTKDEFAPHAELDRETTFALAASALRLPSRITRTTESLESSIAELEKRTPIGWRGNALLAGQLALVFDENLIANLGEHVLSYDRARGLQLNKAPHTDGSVSEGTHKLSNTSAR